MDKSLLKKYAVWAHRELLERIRLRSAQFGFGDEATDGSDTPSFELKALNPMERRQYQGIARRIAQSGYAKTIEDVACTWFNRLCALRFMEVNDYLPSHIRVLSDEHHVFRPQILTDAVLSADRIDGVDLQKVLSMKDEKNSEGLFRYLLFQQCHALHKVLPGLFDEEDDTELLFPENILNSESVVGRLITDIPEAYFSLESGCGQIEIVGWLYQYFISEEHDRVVDPLYGKAIRVEDIPAATQVFTPDWVVRYIVDNSVGRYWMDHHPNSSLVSSLEFYVRHTSRESICDEISPETLTVFDPCVGAGHFLVYTIDVLMKIYRECGYDERDAIAHVIGQNIYGLDIDDRVVELAWFSVMMKGCHYDRSFLSRKIIPHLYSMVDSQALDDAFIKELCISETSLEEDISILIGKFENCGEMGSLIHIPSLHWDALKKRVSNLQKAENSLYFNSLKKFHTLLSVAQILSSHYSVVVTNPPYLNKYDDKLKTFLQKYYKDYKGDLFSAFIYRCTQFCKPEGYAGLMTPNVWMFIKSYGSLRRYILNHHSITTLVQLAKGAFFSEATVDVCAFVIQCQKVNEEGVYFRLEDFSGNMELQKNKLLDAIRDPACSYGYRASSSLFESFPGMPIGYWAGNAMIRAFQTGISLERIAAPRQGLATTDNHKYLRHWYEIKKDDIGFGLDKMTAAASEIKWFPYNKGGEFRKWYGNQDYIVNYYHDGDAIKHDVLTKYPYLKTPDYVVKNQETYFRPCLSWSKISSGSVAFRYFPKGFLYDVSGCSIFFEDVDDLYYHAGFLNSVVSKKILEIISPTLNYEAGHIGVLPVIRSESWRARVIALVKENIRLSREDWNTMETSWDFEKHPLVPTHFLQDACGRGKTGIRIADRFKAWEEISGERFRQLKANEEELNRIFIDIYGMKDELRPDVEDRDVTVRRADRQREIKGLISYAVGCMFGRYSLDRTGLCYSGGDFHDLYFISGSRHDHNNGEPKELCYLKDGVKPEEAAAHFGVVVDNIVPITEDGFFENDMVRRFIEFIRIAYGEDTLEENLRYIADALGGKGTPEEIIRSYCLNDFYGDHLKQYQKRPIYWLFSSGKKRGFQCLIYIHRYAADGVERICADYVHALEPRYQTAIQVLESRLSEAAGGEAVKLNKERLKLVEQAEELRRYAERLRGVAEQKMGIDLEDGVKENYARFGDVLAPIK